MFVTQPAKRFHRLQGMSALSMTPIERASGTDVLS
jgi:hypothetical protein